MSATDTLANPLNLDVTWQQPGDLSPSHGIDRPADRDSIAENMAVNGWQGAPLVVDDRMTDGGYLITGNHRQAAAISAGIEVPVVTLADLCEAVGVDLEAYCDGSYDSEWEPAFWAIPADVRDAYGIQA
jgi:hypothetical protein